MQERGLVGLEARTADGSEVIGRISEVVTDEDTGEVTHVIVQTDGGRDEEQLEVPISSVNLDPEADFAAFHADASDVEPGDHLGDEERPAGYAPNRDMGPEDRTHEGQFVTTPTDENEAASLPGEASTEGGEASNWEDEGSTTFDSGYPRNDAYIDPDTGEEREHYPADGDDLRTDVGQLLDGTGLRLREVIEGVVVLEGSSSRADLEDLVGQISEVDDVLDVDTTDVDVV